MKYISQSVPQLLFPTFTIVFSLEICRQMCDLCSLILQSDAIYAHDQKESENCRSPGNPH